MMDIKGLASMVCKFLDKKSKGSGVTMLANKSALNIRLENSKQLAEEIHELIIRKFKKEQFILDSKIIFGVLI